MSSSNSRFLKLLSFNLRGLAFFLGPKLAARSPLKPVKDFPADHCYGVLYIVEGFVLSLATLLSRLKKICVPGIAPIIHFKHHSWSCCLELLNPVKEFQKPFEKKNSYLACHMQTACF